DERDRKNCVRCVVGNRVLRYWHRLCGNRRTRLLANLELTTRTSNSTAICSGKWRREPEFPVDGRVEAPNGLRCKLAQWRKGELFWSGSRAGSGRSGVDPSEYRLTKR